MAYVLQSKVPRVTLAEALKIPRAISDNYAKEPTAPGAVAEAMGTTSGNSTFRVLAGAADAYGVTKGGPKAETISIEPLGRRIVAPTEEGDDMRAMREAVLQPEIMGNFIRKYSGEKFPSDRIACNVLEEMGVPAEATERALEVIVDNLKGLGLLQSNDDGSRTIKLDADLIPVVEPPDEDEKGADEIGANGEAAVEEGLPDPPEEKSAPPGPIVAKPIFVGHGKQKGPLKQLTKVLDGLKIPYKIAEEEPNLGRPIPTKVKNVMDECGSAIILFTKDEKFINSDGDEIFRPSENAVYELGAASYAYEDRIVIFKQDGVVFPTNFDRVGHISFGDEGVEAKTMDLIKELVGFDLVSITPTAAG